MESEPDYCLYSVIVHFMSVEVDAPIAVDYWSDYRCAAMDFRFKQWDCFFPNSGSRKMLSNRLKRPKLSFFL